MASSLALAGIEKPKHVEFNNILPLAQGKTKKSPYNEIYGAYLNVQRSITKNNIKLLVYPNVPLLRVYDITKDPEEKKDMSSTEKGKELIKKLFPRLLKLQSKMGDRLDLTEAFPQFASK
jgi:arylsulfatase A-like enzyme